MPVKKFFYFFIIILIADQNLLESKQNLLKYVFTFWLNKTKRNENHFFSNLEKIKT